MKQLCPTRDVCVYMCVCGCMCGLSLPLYIFLFLFTCFAGIISLQHSNYIMHQIQFTLNKIHLTNTLSVAGGLRVKEAFDLVFISPS